MKHLIYALILIFSFSAWPQENSIDVVFDLDWTLIYPVKESQMKDSRNLIKAHGEYYRITDWTSDILERLSRKPGLRISFYSGGSSIRNIEVLKQILLKDGRSAYDIAYQILHREDLVEISKDESKKFTERFRKDLTKIQPDLSRVVLVDDSLNFTLEGQAKNQLWLGETYDFYESFHDVPKSSQQFVPANATLWRRERNKLISVYQSLMKVHEKRFSQNPVQFLPATLPVPMPCNLFYD